MKVKAKDKQLESPKKAAVFLKEFREFITFLGTLWGLLAGISVFFPLSSTLLKVIPLQAYEADGVFNHLSPPLITSVSTVITLFVVLSTYGRRNEYMGIGTRIARRQAWVSIGASMAALVVYMTIHQIYGEYAYDVFGLGSDDPLKLFFEIPLLIAYTTFFSLLTRAFMLLGMVEFYRDN
ncbi:hypothetical protein [Desulfogranum marinum]|uniref:hypothetical protein n=1 Tax=Desulfogranum marinum TaxID=453220 RepID=UPI001962984B|nr:hypothetical protein [Desulfogranum marinum]MBM9515199.1 hypothetical protein [Desulfogranum marinum]